MTADGRNSAISSMKIMSTRSLKRFLVNSLRIKLMSRSAEAKIARQKEELDEELRSRPELTEGAVTEIDELQEAIDYLEQKPELSENLSRAARKKRAYQCSSPSYRWVAMAITMLGFIAVAAGIYSFTVHNGLAVYFALFGFAAIFTFAGFSVLPTARNNKKSIMRYDDDSRMRMEEYQGLSGLSGPCQICASCGA